LQSDLFAARSTLVEDNMILAGYGHKPQSTVLIEHWSCTMRLAIDSAFARNKIRNAVLRSRELALIKIAEPMRREAIKRFVRIYPGIAEHHSCEEFEITDGLSDIFQGYNLLMVFLTSSNVTIYQLTRRSILRLIRGRI
jgi:hypothetical protein